MNWRLLLLGVEVFMTKVNNEHVVYITSMDEKEDLELIKELKRQCISYNIIKLDSDPKFKLKLVNCNNDICVYIHSDRLTD